jgi:cytidylate kinase
MNRLITISREFGSGGRIIGRMVAEKLGIPFYDKELIEMACKKSGLSRDIIETAELKAKSAFSYTLSSAVNFGEGFAGDSISMNEKLFLTQFEIITQIGNTGQGVIIGRCADYVLKDFDNVTNVFIFADYEDRVKRCIDQYGVDPDKAEETVKAYDKARVNYYNFHTSQKWGNYKNYDLMLNTSVLSDEAAEDQIVEFIMNREYDED